MSKADVVGRLFLVLIFLAAGCMKFQETSNYTSVLSNSYSKLFAAASNEFGIHLPVNPALVAVYATQLIQLTAILQITGGVLTLLNKKLGAFIIIFLLLMFNLVIHNPFIYKDLATQVFHGRCALLNFAILGGFLTIGCGKK